MQGSRDWLQTFMGSGYQAFHLLDHSQFEQLALVEPSQRRGGWKLPWNIMTLDGPGWRSLAEVATDSKQALFHPREYTKPHQGPQTESLWQQLATEVGRTYLIFL